MEGPFVPCIGHGYNLLTDKVSDSIIYKHTAGEKKHGMVVPEGATFRKLTSSKVGHGRLISEFCLMKKITSNVE